MTPDQEEQIRQLEAIRNKALADLERAKAEHRKAIWTLRQVAVTAVGMNLIAGLFNLLMFAVFSQLSFWGLCNLVFAAYGFTNALKSALKYPKEERRL